MKNNRLYFLLLFVFLLLVFLYQYYSPKEFVWSPTFSKYDKQPFGSYVFDDVVSTSANDYRVENKTFYQLYREFGGTRDLEKEVEEIGEAWEVGEIGEVEEEESLDYVLSPEERCAFLITENNISLTEVEVRALLNLLRQGHKIMLCSHSLPQVLCDSIGFTARYDGYYNAKEIVRFAREGKLRDSLFLGTDSLRPERIYMVYPHLHSIVIEERPPIPPIWLENDIKPYYDWSETLVRNKNGKPVVLRLGIGEGELFLVVTPLMFTNYGMLDGDNASYAFRLLSFVKDMPLIRIEAYGVNNQVSGSPLRYLLSQPSLRWALYATLFTIVLCMIFTAKRRQWLIPVVRPPANETLRFAQLIGNLYYQRQDFKDLLQKKYLYFCAEVKQLNGLDLHADEADEERCRRLSDRMGQDFGEVWPVYAELKRHLQEGAIVDETTMMRLIDKMNEWTLQCK